MRRLGQAASCWWAPGHLWSTAASLSASRATCVAFLQPEMMVWGWIFLETRSSASCGEKGAA